MNKIQRKAEAIKHFNSFQTKYKNQIENSVQNTMHMKIADTPILQDEIDKVFGKHETKISMRKTDTVSAIYGLRVDGDNLTILNFASYKHPGGGYINGTMAQEEALCTESNLYNILKTFDDTIYEEQRKATNFGLYASNLLYTPDVVFLRSGYIKKCGVITCAAPNASAALKHKEVSIPKVEAAMKERIDYILYSAAIHTKRDTLVLGAFGCGVFGNDVQNTAEIFKKLIVEKYKGVFKEIIFAIPDQEKYNVFKNVLIG